MFMFQMKQKLHANSFSRNSTLFLISQSPTHKNPILVPLILFWFWCAVCHRNCWLGQFRLVKIGMKMGSWLSFNPFPNFNFQCTQRTCKRPSLWKCESIVHLGRPVCGKIAFKLKTFITVFLRWRKYQIDRKITCAEVQSSHPIFVGTNDVYWN